MSRHEKHSSKARRAAALGITARACIPDTTGHCLSHRNGRGRRAYL